MTMSMTTTRTSDIGAAPRRIADRISAGLPESRIGETLIEEVLKIAEVMDDARTPSGVPAVTVS
ncbi:hypothetical protein [Streptomyces brevispora]|uniref:Uncharacterized protein n=1 Tax=Streptomyces brevispora TaxID=887462 RepID=A0ABZ1FZZ5_9ACTN|nr:hypothetical protein [Streptomyces brevispora]WSC12063.1 hypothetical protein OIE64_03850 [Streptomyces brevispora]